jgi:hypothetical protein
MSASAPGDSTQGGIALAETSAITQCRPRTRTSWPGSGLLDATDEMVVITDTVPPLSALVPSGRLVSHAAPPAMNGATTITRGV